MKDKLQWFRMDLHLHTPASKDYQEPDISYLDILQQAERRGLDIIAFTDHNTVRGYRIMVEQFQQLEWLEKLGRITSDEEYQLKEYRRLFEKILVLPGFEFTATFGFHILGIFSPSVEIRYLEHLLLDLNIPPESLDVGETNIGASADVLTAYHAINNAGGLVIAAHANSNHGVAMRGINFGGQTRIAYTQDPHLHALEVTDLDRKGRRTTAKFFDGSKPEYPRPMRSIQGSDAHRLVREGKNYGIGERVTEIAMPELTYEALAAVFTSNDFARTRPYRGTTTAPFDHVLAARQEGPSIVQDFHESMTVRGGRMYAVVADICAFANTNGGTLYVGTPSDPNQKPPGVKGINQSVEQLMSEIQRKITPPIEAQVDVIQTQGVAVIRVQIPRGTEPPYAIDDNKIYVRDDTETSLAVRDEIVQMVVRGYNGQIIQASKDAELVEGDQPEPEDAPPESDIQAPRTGVEIVATEKRNGNTYHSVRDLRNGNIVRNVTRQSARKLWHYAITQVEDKGINPASIKWQAGDIAVISSYTRAGRTRYDLAQRVAGQIRIYYGVTEDGVQDATHQVWREILELEDED